MIKFYWLRMGNFLVYKDGVSIATISPSTPENSKVSFEQSFSGNREKEGQKIIKAFFSKTQEPAKTAIA